MITISGHTIDETLLSDGCVIDVGCRGFEFSSYFYGRKVFCIDPDEQVFDMAYMVRNGLVPIIAAISDKAGSSAIYRNGEGTVLKELDPDQGHPFVPCKTITMDDLYKITGENVDILKLDCEGAEYMILGDTFQPIPKQLSIEWHRHCLPEMHDRLYPECKARLLKHYVMIDEVMEPKHGCGENIWDQLWLRRDVWQS